MTHRPENFETAPSGTMDALIDLVRLTNQAMIRPYSAAHGITLLAAQHRASEMVKAIQAMKGGA